MEENSEIRNPLGIEPISKLLRKFAIPSIVAMLVSSFYNIVDQFFIGRTVGTLGNAATNVAFPVSTICVALGLLFGIGGAAAFNIEMGKGNKEKARKLTPPGFLYCTISRSLILTHLETPAGTHRRFWCAL